MSISADHVVADQEPVFRLLADPATYGLKEAVGRIDTHGAVVFLAGADVYKVKRAVRFSFMDFSTLEKRRRACAREIEINRATAPELYLGLVPIVRRGGALHLGGEGEQRGDTVEWAVHMRRFDEGATLGQGGGARGLPARSIAALAEQVARMHERAPAATPPPGGLAQGGAGRRRRAGREPAGVRAGARGRARCRLHRGLRPAGAAAGAAGPRPARCAAAMATCICATSR